MTEPRSDLDRELAIEQTHVDLVYHHLAKATKSAKTLAENSQQIFKTDRNNFLREEDSTALFERDAFVYQSAKRLSTLDAEHEGLVFGRIDLVDPETRYIGRIGVRDEEYEPLVIDWRAPAAEPFYRATPANPMSVVRRRVLRCQNDKVIGIEDDLLDSQTQTDLAIIGEGALIASLSRARGHTMRDIVATIQAEQDKAIRAPYQGVTMILGGPGTGKTVVALHRAAYLLYSNRARLEAGGVLVVGPSSVFMNYIERVLPSLGEDSVVLKPIGSVASDVLGIRPERIDDSAAATLKGSLLMLDVLQNLVSEPLIDHPAALQVKVSVKGEILSLNSSELAKIRAKVLAYQKLNLGTKNAEQQVVDALRRKIPQDVLETLENADELIRDQAAFQMFMKAWWPQLTPTRVLSRLADSQIIDKVAPKLSAEQRKVLADSYTWLSEMPYEYNSEPNNGWSVADAALLDELMAILGPVKKEDEIDLFLESGDISEIVTTADILTNAREIDPLENQNDTYSHVLVDEAQDITPMQWRMLRRRGPQASWSIVGDPAQSSYPYPEETTEAIKQLIGSGPVRNFKLTTNYRSPIEIFNLSSKVIKAVFPDADLPKAVRSTGIEPILAQATPQNWVSELTNLLLRLSKLVDGTIGVICAPSRITEITKFILANPELADLDSRIAIVTALESKGLEYDAAIVVNPDEIVDEVPGRERVLYVALTRPTQRLVTLDITEGQEPKWYKYLDIK